MKTILKILSTCFCFLIMQESHAQKLDIHAFKDPKGQSVICKIKNNDTVPYYIPNDPFFCDLGDTLFVEAVFKQKTADDPILHYFQFNPPQMDEISTGETIIQQLDYKFSTDLICSRFLAVRIYKQKLDDNAERDSLKYHSYTHFLNFEQTHSFVIKVRIEE